MKCMQTQRDERVLAYPRGSSTKAQNGMRVLTALWSSTLQRAAQYRCNKPTSVRLNKCVGACAN